MMLRFSIHITTFFLILVLLAGCDFSNSTDGSPDSVEGTWTGSLTASAKVDTMDSNGNPVQATGELTRDFKLVVADDEGDLSVNVTIEQEGFIEYESGESANLDRRSSFEASGTYGPPTMVITELPATGSDMLGYDLESRWEFEVEDKTAEGTLDVSLGDLEDPYHSPDNGITPYSPPFWVIALREEGKGATLKLNKR